jgi:large subunit ribosomal protein L7Ae
MAPKTKSGKKKTSKAKAVAKAPLTSASKSKAKTQNPLFMKDPKNFGIGQNVRPKRDLSRFVRWPKYIRLQRQKRVLYQRLKVPPTINQFTQCLDAATTAQLFKLASKYKPESKAAKKVRLAALAAAKAKDASATPAKRPALLQYGVNKVVSLIERKKAQLVVIAHDVDPLELVLFLPSLCRKMEIPYVIVKSRARVGQALGRKMATCFAFSEINSEDKTALARLCEAARTNYLDRFDEIRRSWGGGVLGRKSQHRIAKQQRAALKEQII